MISVVVPVLNEEKYLTSCLAALAVQSYKDYEVIVVDGGSSDRTVEIAEEFAVRILSDPRRPVGAARNAGAEVARGEILAFIDADTVASSSWLETIAQNFNHSRVVGVTGPTLPIDGDGFDQLLYRVSNDYMQRVMVALSLPLFPGFNCAYRRQPFFEAGGFDESKVLSEDTHLSLRLTKLGRTVFDKRMLTYTSTRRLAEYGCIYMLTLYILSALLMLLADKSFSHYPPVR